jgi:hypothetical protein
MAETAASERIKAPLARLARAVPHEAAAAAAALDIVLAPLRVSCWPDVAWRASRLTDDGFPVEFAWSSRDDTVRWTAEVAPPETPEASRPDTARRLAAELSGQPVAALPAIAASDGRLRFGAWLGGRHDLRGSRYKIYVERPTLRNNESSLLHAMEIELSRRVAVRIIGAETGDAARELYCRVKNLSLRDLDRLLRWARIPERAAFARAVAAITGPAACAVQSLARSTGLSITIRNAQPVALSWFVPARVAIATNRTATEATIAACTAIDRDASLLLALVGGRRQPLGRIGMIGVGAARDGGPWVQASWRPE